MPPRIYIDGHAGTTGLRIRDWMAKRDDVALITLPEASRKDPEARRGALVSADLAILCLPDDAAREASAWAAEADVRLIDSSTAHRVADGWVFGLPELCPEQRQRVAQARFVSNPGCYPVGFLLLMRPLVDAGLIDNGAPFAIHALSGYSGGGRQLIERWEDPANDLQTLAFEAPYALDRVHKHIPEMTAYSGLSQAPQFVPAVGPFRCGMRVQVPVPASSWIEGASAKTAWECLAERYAAEPFVRVAPFDDGADIEAAERRFDPRACNDTNRVELHVLPNPAGHVLLMAVLDNLGKGASGTAIQSMNLMLGLGEETGLPA